MSKLRKGELLEELDTWKRLLMRDWTEQDEKAFQQIETLVEASKEVTEEWIEKKGIDFIVKANVAIQTPEAYKQQLKICKDFIRSLLKEIHGRK